MKDDSIKHVKILFEISDEDWHEIGAIESMWATCEGEYYKVDNIPFFLKGIASGDIVEAMMEFEMLNYVRTVQHSGNSTIHVIFFKENDDVGNREGILKKLVELGAEYERYNDSLVAINIPAEVNILPMREILLTLEQSEALAFQESKLSVAHYIEIYGIGEEDLA